MKDDTALQRYLQRHIEAELPPAPRGRQWQQVLVIPAYRESPIVIERLKHLEGADRNTLVILVLNRPDSDPDTGANDLLRKALAQLPALSAGHGDADSLRAIGPGLQLYCHDLEHLQGPTPASQGVGLARKCGCDIALQWIASGAIDSRWICVTDADATLPADYFERLESANDNAVAAVYPFLHDAGEDHSCNAATNLYELRLHYYVLGLLYAGSVYACHTLGSCLAVDANAYTQVRGFPRRAGGEDFYLLNKLAKIGAVSRLTGSCIALDARWSPRVPFGTGPAVQRISESPAPRELPLFYNPQSFRALKAVLAVAAALPAEESSFQELLQRELAEEPLAESTWQALRAMGIEQALEHCRRQGKSNEQFARQFHQWFDGFRSLKFIHSLRSAGFHDLSLADLATTQPRLWPPGAEDLGDVPALLQACRGHFGWTTRNHRD